MAYRALHFRRCADKRAYPTMKAAEDEQDRWTAMGYIFRPTEPYECPLCNRVHFKTCQGKSGRTVR